MDRTEQIVYKYIQSLKFTNVIYEPDGNIPPDFLIDGRIAVEVRRLNQNRISTSGKITAFEEIHIPLLQRLSKFLTSIGPIPVRESWFVSIKIQNPLEPWHVLKSKMHAILETFMHSANRETVSFPITTHFELNISRAGKIYPSFFRLGTLNDHDAGGFVLSEIIRNLNLVIVEKARKIAAYKHQYPYWWLILPDYIGYHMDAEDRLQFRQLPQIVHDWDKIILLDPLNPLSGFEV